MMGKKDGMLVTSIFSISDSIFYLLTLSDIILTFPFENIVGKGENAGNQHFLLFPQCFLSIPSFNFSVTFIFLSASFFSSPEHNVLRGSYCDRSSSVVRPSVRLSVRPSICPSVNNFFKNLLLQNQKANLDKTWQECSLGEALQKLLKEFNSNKNSGCHGNKMAENGKNL